MKAHTKKRTKKRTVKSRVMPSTDIGVSNIVSSMYPLSFAPSKKEQQREIIISTIKKLTDLL